MRIPLIYYCIALIVLFLLYLKTKKIALSILIAYMFLVFAQTVLIRRNAPEAYYQLIPLWVHGIGLKSHSDIFNQMLANVVMFIPIGFLAAIVLKKYSFIVGISFSLTIELIQYFAHKGMCETDDVISNSMGTLIGIILFLLTKKVLQTDLFSLLRKEL